MYASSPVGSPSSVVPASLEHVIPADVLLKLLVAQTRQVDVVEAITPDLCTRPRRVTAKPKAARIEEPFGARTAGRHLALYGPSSVVMTLPGENVVVTCNVSSISNVAPTADIVSSGSGNGRERSKPLKSQYKSQLTKNETPIALTKWWRSAGGIGADTNGPPARTDNGGISWVHALMTFSCFNRPNGASGRGVAHTSKPPS